MFLFFFRIQCSHTIVFQIFLSISVFLFFPNGIHQCFEFQGSIHSLLILFQGYVLFIEDQRKKKPYACQYITYTRQHIILFHTCICSMYWTIETITCCQIEQFKRICFSTNSIALTYISIPKAADRKNNWKNINHSHLSVAEHQCASNLNNVFYTIYNLQLIININLANSNKVLYPHMHSNSLTKKKKVYICAAQTNKNGWWLNDNRRQSTKQVGIPDSRA